MRPATKTRRPEEVLSGRRWVNSAANSQASVSHPSMKNLINADVGYIKKTDA